MLHSLLSSLSWFGLENNEHALVIKEKMEGLFHLDHDNQSLPVQVKSLQALRCTSYQFCQYCKINSKNLNLGF